LPGSIKAELIPRRKFDYELAVETHKADVIAYLDKVMRVDRYEFSRARHVEITKDEIENYDYFFIDVRTMDWKKHIDYEVARPTCKRDGCPWGARRTSPTRIYSRCIRGVNIARISDIWHIGTRFVISERLKALFDAAGVTGLAYEPCLIEHRKPDKSAPVVFSDRLYVGEIRASAAERADKIFMHYYCRKHRVIIDFDRCNLRIPRAHVLPYDFQMADRLTVGRKEYIQIHPTWFVSRRVVKILLEHARQDLRPRGYYLKQLFLPVPLEDETGGSGENRSACKRASRGPGRFAKYRQVGVRE